MKKGKDAFTKTTKKWFLNNMVKEKKKSNLNLYLTPHRKLISRWIIDVNINKECRRQHRRIFS